MSASVRTNQWLSVVGWRGLFRDRPIIPLVGLLAVLILAIELADPGIVGPE